MKKAVKGFRQTYISKVTFEINACVIQNMTMNAMVNKNTRYITRYSNLAVLTVSLCNSLRTPAGYLWHYNKNPHNHDMYFD